MPYLELSLRCSESVWHLLNADMEPIRRVVIYGIFRCRTDPKSWNTREYSECNDARKSKHGFLP